MCNRAERGVTQKVLNVFGAKIVQSFNEGPIEFHPKSPGLVVREVEGERVVEQMTWGFPVTLKGKQGQPLKPKPVNNARFDKLGTFWRPWATDPRNRCLIPTARFAEAVGEKGRMTETWLSVREQPIFAWAGLLRNSDEWGPAFTGVMTSNCLELAHIHDRSPVILDPADWDTWLQAPLDELYQFDRPYPAERIVVEATDRPWFRKAEAGRDVGDRLL
jgi:putative SOS response-associated peptidase YedK